LIKSILTRKFFTHLEIHNILIFTKSVTHQ